jgi:hypothetical protein
MNNWQAPSVGLYCKQNNHVGSYSVTNEQVSHFPAMDVLSSIESSADAYVADKF